MGLRVKLALTLVASSLVVAAILYLVAERIREHEEIEALADAAEANAEVFLARCEAQLVRRDARHRAREEHTRPGRRTSRASRSSNMSLGSPSDRAQRHASRQDAFQQREFHRRESRRRGFRRRSARFGRQPHGPLPPVAFYRADFSPEGRAPLMPDALTQQLEDADIGSIEVDGFEYENAPDGLKMRLVAARIGNGVTAPDGSTGHCAIAVLHRPARQPGVGILLLLLLPALVSGLAALLAAGPTIRRIRRIHRAVESESQDAIKQEGRDELSALSLVIAEDRARLASQLEKIKQREQTLSDYITNTMHDVMIPLTVLQGHLAEIESVDTSENPKAERQTMRPERRLLLLSAFEEAQYVASLLENLSTAAKLEGVQEAVSKGPAELGKIVERVVARHKPIARRKPIELDFSVPETPIVAAIDATLMERALSNIVHNAVRYGNPGGHVAVILTTKVNAPEADSWKLVVLDDGPGVSDDELLQLGQRRFRSEEARTRHAGGQGLGLSIAREVAERFSLKLSFEHGKGAANSGLKVRLEPA